jgi:hypothetical protein
MWYGTVLEQKAEVQYLTNLNTVKTGVFSVKILFFLSVSALDSFCLLHRSSGLQTFSIKDRNPLNPGSIIDRFYCNEKNHWHWQFLNITYIKILHEMRAFFQHVHHE